MAVEEVLDREIKTKDKIPDKEIKVSDKIEHIKSKTISSLNYNIQIHLPETRDTAVYDAIFKSLKEHIL